MSINDVSVFLILIKSLQNFWVGGVRKSRKMWKNESF